MIEIDRCIRADKFLARIKDYQNRGFSKFFGEWLNNALAFRCIFRKTFVIETILEATEYFFLISLFCPKLAKLPAAVIFLTEE